MIQLTGHGLALRDVWQIAHRRSGCELPASARTAMSASRARAEKVAAQLRAVHGTMRARELLESGGEQAQLLPPRPPIPKFL